MEYGRFNVGDAIYFGIKDKGNNPKDYKFNSETFQSFINNRQYEQAADYLGQYHFTDLDKDQQRINTMNSIRRKGRILNAVYGKMNSDQQAQVEFADNVFGGLGSLVNRTNKEGTQSVSDNPYAKQYIDAVRQVGSTFKDGQMVQEAKGLEITFEPKKQYGIFGWDWTARDNKNNIENFYSTLGMNRKDLEAAGVQVIEKDGKTTLKFDKTNDLTNKLLYNLPDVENTPSGTGQRSITNIPGISIKGIDSKGRNIERADNNTLLNLSTLKYLINDANQVKTEAYKTNDLSEIQTSSTVGAFINPQLEALNQAYREGAFAGNEDEYKRQLKMIDGGVYEGLIRAMGTDQVMYSNFGDPNIEALKEMDPEQRMKLIQQISSANSHDIQLNAMVSNGSVGTLITINGSKLTGKQAAVNPTVGENINEGRIQIFVPGLFSEQAQQLVDSDVETRAAQELNTLAQYGYDVPLNTLDPEARRNGTSEYYLSAGSNGYYMTKKNSKGEVLDSKPLDTASATKILAKEFFVEDGVNQLMAKHVNINGDLIDPQAYEADARKLAVVAGYNFNPNNGLITLDERTHQSRPLTYDEIFSKYQEPKFLEGDDTRSEEFSPSDIFNYDSLNRVDYQTYRDIFDIYDTLMGELTQFNTETYGKYKAGYLNYL